MEVNKNMKIADILRSNPNATDVFKKYNMGCISCLGIQNETLEKGALMHGIDVYILIKELSSI